MHLRILSILAVLLLFNGSADLCRAQNRYAFRDGELWGYLDSKGHVVIPAKYEEAKQFSDGLAVVRTKGVFGFIDVDDRVVVEARFDAAQDFIKGTAIVYVGDKARVIDKAGRILFNSDFDAIRSFNGHNYTCARTRGGGYVLIDRLGKQLCPRSFMCPPEFHGGLAVVDMLPDSSNLLHDSSAVGLTIGVVDTNGRIIVPSGKYGYVSEFYNGYARVSTRGVHGLLSVSDNIPLREIDSQGREHEISKNNAHISPSIFKPDTAILAITNPEFGRVFVQYKTGSYELRDLRAHSLSDVAYDAIADFASHESGSRHFSDYGHAVVVSKKQYLLIDTNARLVCHLPIEFRDSPIMCCEFDSVLFVYMEREIGGAGQVWSTWVVNKYNNQVCKTPFFNCEAVGKYTTLLLLTNDSTSAYMTSGGTYIWKEKARPASPRMNIAWMKTRTFQNFPSQNFSSQGESQLSNPLDSTLLPLRDWQCCQTVETMPSLILRDSDTLRLEGYKARSIELRNCTAKPLMCRATIDGYVAIVLQAQDSLGAWRIIELSDACEQSGAYSEKELRNFSLMPRQQWNFLSYNYAGSIPTKIRARLSYCLDSNCSKLSYLYSNEIDGFINPAQLWRVQRVECGCGF